MIPLAIRRHSLQDLTQGQSVVLTVPSCEERQIRRGVGTVNAERSDGLRLKTLRTPDGLRVWLVESVDIADCPEWQTGKSKRFPGRDPVAVQKSVVKLNEWARVMRRISRPESMLPAPAGTGRAGVSAAMTSIMVDTNPQAFAKWLWRSKA